MQSGKLYRGPNVLLAQVWRADTALTRARGLLGRPPLESGQGLAIVPCNAVHMIGMRYPLDVVFIDAADNVIKLCKNLGKWRVAMALGAAWTLELRVGEIDRLGLSLGDRLQWRSI